MKASSILGLNARTHLYSYEYNHALGKKIASSKYKTYKYLKKAGIPTPEVLKRFAHPEDILKFDWNKLPDSFALKPSKGLGGEGIIIAQKRAKDGNGWLTTNKKRITIEDLKLHTLDILEGAYSMRNDSDMALIQEYVGRHKQFKKLAYRGTPDIRVIVFNKVPVMAMLRLPTRDSGGRANLHQGAMAVGIDISTGITTHAIWYGEYIKFKPGTKKKLHGIKIPQWNKILELAVSCQIATKLGYVGVDIIIHPERGPMILELNYQPGLQIQLANKAGLRKRLERVEDLEVRNAEHGVTISKSLFSSSFSSKVKEKKDIKTVSALEDVVIKGMKKGQKKKVIAKIDTGAWRTSIDERLATELGLLHPDNILWSKIVKSTLGRQKRPVVSLTFWLQGTKITTPASVAKRMALRYPVIIGRKNLKGFLVDPHVKDMNKVNKKTKN